MGGEKFVFAAAFPGTSRRQRKSFSVQQFFQKCCRGVGEQPTFAKQMKLSGNCNKNLRENWKNRNCL